MEIAEMSLETAEQIIVEAWKQKITMINKGFSPQKVILSRRNYEMIQNYHQKLGFLPDGQNDYISRYMLFDLVVFIDNTVECLVS